MEIPYKKRKPFEILKLPNKECNIDTYLNNIFNNKKLTLPN